MNAEPQFGEWLRWSITLAVVVGVQVAAVIAWLVRGERRMTRLEEQQEANRKLFDKQLEAAAALANQREKSLTSWVRDLNNQMKDMDQKLDRLIERLSKPQ